MATGTRGKINNMGRGASQAFRDGVLVIRNRVYDHSRLVDEVADAARSACKHPNLPMRREVSELEDLGLGCANLGAGIALLSPNL